jgi:hypothetical protein
MPSKPIKYIEYDDYVEGILHNGVSFLFDKEDYDFVKRNSWHQINLNNENNPYINSTKYGTLHRYLMRDKLSDKLQVDHINMNKLDNRKSNLRVVTQQENLHKKTVYKTNTSGHQGIKWNKHLNKWQVQITRNKKRVHLGVFANLQDAIIARRLAEQQF